MKSLTLDYRGHTIEVDIHPLKSSPGQQRTFDLAMRAPADIPDAVLDELLHYLHKEGFFDNPDSLLCQTNSTCQP